MPGTDLLYTLPGGPSKRCVLSLQDTGLLYALSTGLSVCCIHSLQSTMPAIDTVLSACCVHSLQCAMTFVYIFLQATWTVAYTPWDVLLLLLPSRFSRVRLCDPIDGSPPGSPVPGILQARNWSVLPFPSPMHESEK